MNADSFGSEMESELDLEERGFGGVGITDEDLALTRNIEMRPETWLDFSIDEEEDLDRMCVFFLRKQTESQCLNFLRKETNIIYIICV